MHKSGSDDLEKGEKFLFNSIENIQDLHLVMLSVLTEIRKKEEEFLEKSSHKILATPEERNPNKKFINNQIIHLLENSRSFLAALENRKIDFWFLREDYIQLLLKDIKASWLYEKYMSTRTNTFDEDRRFVFDIFTEVIAPNEKLYESLEDEKITWVDDIPVVNTNIAKQLKQLENTDAAFMIPSVYRDSDDRDFARDLFRKTLLNEDVFAKEYIDKTPNWDADRIAEADTIMLKMAICEFLKFPSIPVKVTINEYLEISKEYSTPKSSIFINGVLDNLVKDYTTMKRLNKVGRGLI